MGNRKIYCHTSFDNYKEDDVFGGIYNIISGNWYEMAFMEFNSIKINYFVIQHCSNFTSTLNCKFSDYFYTEQEYNRIKSLNELLNE